jgi:signal transduction histidine kinase
MRPGAAVLAICTAAFAWYAGACSARAEIRNVVLLFDERPELPGLALLERDFVTTLRSASSETVEIYRESMDLSRFTSANHQTHLRDFLREKYRDKKVDVAVAVMGPALDFLLRERDAVFPDAQIVFCGIDRSELTEPASHVNGVLIRRDFRKTVDLALALHPGTERIFVVAGTSDFDLRILNQARAEFRTYEERSEITYLDGLPLTELLVQVSRLPAKSIVLFTTFFRDGTGRTFVPHEVVERVSAAANAPVYGFVDQFLGRGIVGGHLYSVGAHGAEAAKLTARLMIDGSSAASVVEPPNSTTQFDWRQMQRWNVPVASLPFGSEVRFREPTLWSQYRLEFLVLATVLSLQSGLILWLVLEHRRRQRAEVQSRNAMAELTRLDRRAGAGALSASIAHEVSQPLAAISARTGAALRWLRAEKPDVERASAALEHVVAATRRASGVVDGVCAMFKKDATVRLPIDVNELVLTTLSIVSVELRRNGVEVQTSLAERLPTVLGARAQLQQVILNLIMNAIEAMQSAPQRALKVTTAESRPGVVRVSIEDSGMGVAPTHRARIFDALFTTKSSGMGMGLSICKSIIETHDGRIWSEPGDGGGSIFWFELPVATTVDAPALADAH